MTSCAQIHKMTRVLWQKYSHKTHIKTKKSFIVLRHTLLRHTSVKTVGRLKHCIAHLVTLILAWPFT